MPYSFTHGLVIPVFNEPRIARLVARIPFEKHDHVVIVDDGSTDDSLFAVRNSPAIVIRHDRRTGVGAAIRTGLLHLKGMGVDVAVVMAGSNKDDPADIPALLNAIRDGADYVQASRYAKGARAENMPFLRDLITRTVPLLWSLRFGRRFTEVTSGFRAYRLSILDRPGVDIGQDWLNRYELEHYLQYKALELGLNYVEIPVTKQYPTDKMSYTKIRLWRDWWSLMSPLVLLSLGLRR